MQSRKSSLRQPVKREPGTAGRSEPRGPQDGADPRYGWTIVGTLALTETVSWGVLYYAFAVFLVPMKNEFGWSTTELTAAFTLALVVSASAAIPIGRWLDVHSPRLLMSFGSAAAALLVFAWSRVETLPQLYLVFLGVGLAQAAVLYDAAFVVVAKWFSVRRREALTAVTLVAGAASLVFSPLSERLIEAHGWRYALVVLATMLATLTLPLHAIVLRPAPQTSAERPSGGIRARSPRGLDFWLLAASFAIGGFLVSAISVHLVAMLIAEGHQLAFAALVAGLVGIAQVPGRLLFAAVGRRLPSDRLPAAVFGIGAFALALLALDRSAPAAVGFALLFGASGGMTTLLRPVLVAELYGPRDFGASLGTTGAFSMGARAVAPLATAALALLPGGYMTVLWLLSVAGLLAALASTRAVALRQSRD